MPFEAEKGGGLLPIIIVVAEAIAGCIVLLIILSGKKAKQINPVVDSQDTKQCPYCHETLDAQDSFCGNCGHAL